MTKPLIVHVVAYYPPHIGGMEQVAQVAADALAKDGYPVRVLTSTQSGRAAGITRGTDVPEVISLRSFEFAHTPIAPGLLWHLMSLPRHSIIHLHLSQAYYPELVLLASQVRRIPYIAHFHLDVPASGIFGRIFLWYKSIFWKLVLQGARQVITCSESQKHVVIEKYGVSPNNVTIIANAVAPEFFSDKARVPLVGVFRLLYVGRLASQKRVERILSALPLAKAPVRLTIVGDGEERIRLETQAKEMGLSMVTFVGAKTAFEIQSLQSQHDLFVISSDCEGGTPIVVLEAMAAGLPVIGTNVSGIRELVGEVGVLVNEPYAQGFARAIDDLWQHPDIVTILSEKGRSASKHYSRSHFVGALELVYARIDQHNSL